MYPFYESLILGKTDIFKSYGIVLSQIKDASHMEQIQKENENYFTSEMCVSVVENVAKFGIYGQYNAQSEVLGQLHLNVDHDAIEFIQDISEEDHKNMEQLNWLKQKFIGEDSLVQMLKFYNELARKLLLEGKYQSAGVLLENHFYSNISWQ